MPGIIYERIKEKFPIKQQKKSFVISIQNKDGEIFPGQESKSQIEQIAFLSEDKKALLQLGSNLFAVNHLKPYPGWTVSKKIIFDYFNIYLESAGNRKIETIGLRFINRFCDVEINSFSEYFTVSPQLTMKYPSKNFFIRNELVNEELNSTLFFTMGTAYDKAKEEEVIDDQGIEEDYFEMIEEFELPILKPKLVQQVKARVISKGKGKVDFSYLTEYEEILD